MELIVWCDGAWCCDEGVKTPAPSTCWCCLQGVGYRISTGWCCIQRIVSIDILVLSAGEVDAAVKWMEDLEIKKRGHCANVGGASAAVASGAINGDDEVPPPSLQAADVAMSAVELLRECCACECLLAAHLLRPALAPPSGGMCIQACMWAMPPGTLCTLPSRYPQLTRCALWM